MAYTPVGPQVLYVADPAFLAALVGHPPVAAAHALLREQTAAGEALQVNAKQHRAILRRREKRRREDEKGQLLHSRKAYQNKLVHDFASSRPRNEKGHFVAARAAAGAGAAAAGAAAGAAAAAAAARSQPPTGRGDPEPAVASLAIAEREGIAAEGGLGANPRPKTDAGMEDGVTEEEEEAGAAAVTGDDALAAEALACLPQVPQQQQQEGGQQQEGLHGLPAASHGQQRQQGAEEGQSQH